jgi:hypothetical protein
MKCVITIKVGKEIERKFNLYKQLIMEVNRSFKNEGNTIYYS